MNVKIDAPKPERARYFSGNSAVIEELLRPVALRPHLSMGLPLSVQLFRCGTAWRCEALLSLALRIALLYRADETGGYAMAFVLFRVTLFFVCHQLPVPLRLFNLAQL